MTLSSYFPSSNIICGNELSPSRMYPSSFKRMRLAEQIMDFTDPFAVARHIDELNEEKYGSATKEYEEVHAWRMKFINLLPPYLIKPCSNSEHQSLQISLSSNSQPSGLCKKVDLVQNGNKSLVGDVIELDSDSDADGVNPTFTQSYQYEKPIFTPVVVRQPPSIQYEKVSFGEKVEVQINKSPKSQLLTFQDNKDLASLSSPTKKQKRMKKNRKEKKEKKEKDVEKEKKLDVSTTPSIPLLSSADHSPQMLHQNQDDVEVTESDGLEDLWNDMSLAIEFSKDVEPSAPVEKEEECCHSFILKDDLGIVCRVCGVVHKSIETIFDFQWAKTTRDARYYGSGTRKHEDMDEAVDASNPNYPEEDTATDLGIDPQHRKLMKPHQIEGFRFLVKNLMVEKPGGCILAHAPGSGKTFMLISFMQSFITQKPNKRPLVVLPKGILATWKREFQLWQSEDIPLFDFYSSKADHRSQQLDILKNWEQSRGILFLGYKQFTNIVSSTSTEKIDALCREKLLMVPGLVILDEGHTPRNNNTALVQSLSRIKTPRKVVLSGTLFQNHVKEVFNILKLVRPKFMKEESSRNVMKRILSSVEISAGRRPTKGCRESAFCDLIHETLQNDDNRLRKNLVIKDLREMTHNVLHYYKGDFLDELPGLVDFTVFLKLTSKQKNIMTKLHKLDIFKGNSVGSAVYLHPCLKEVAESFDGDKTESLSNDKVDGLIGSLNVRDGVKTKFFLRVLSLSESAGERLLVFSRYILPLKFLERLVIQKKGWRLGKEVFMISGDSNPEDREWSMEQFNNSADARVLFGSIKACGEGISLIGASRILILDVHLNPSVTRQAIGRAFRPGQQRKVYTYRLVAADSPEEEHHSTSFKKEVISKLWFEYNDYGSHQEIDLHEVELTDAEDIFLENPALIEDIKCLYKR
ncbi:protein CHROMATIN REMODELING 35 [Phalaenopsis equestris]|uniref:protein CHROMATIN REMODELING 35 n=1 Tax=Phalaenopsis equestris TaxID=78828 RepID=UPI0009E3FE66|nr:protein CHROMATIN REMODELING 35 [Phalaenopsis equestris]